MPNEIIEPSSGESKGGYQVQEENQCGVLHSQEKLNNAANELRELVERDGCCSIVSRPCQTEEDSLAYRCKCSFQVIIEEVDDANNKLFQYATRHEGRPVVLGTSISPIANRRIQLVMKGLLEHVLNGNGANKRLFHNISTNLASVTFVASWNDDFDHQDPLQSSSDCILTLNYHSAIEDEDAWKQEALQVCSGLKLSQIHGRSRNRLLSAIPMADENSLSNAVLRDTIWLCNNNHSGWKVSLSHPGGQHRDDCIAVHYEKPESAFFHPNARVMCQALEWTLNRLTLITTSIEQSTGTASSLRLLEMYSGCGAHTIAIAKARLVSSIWAVELDARLVDACRANTVLNELHVQKVPEEDQAAVSSTPIEVVQGDAGRWAKEQHRKAASPDNSQSENRYSILLVDPPRQGLDDQVLNTAIHSDSFEHILIISCGHDALVRDLRVLCNHFEIVNCTQLDLFPRTESIETLVHLRRRKA